MSRPSYRARIRERIYEAACVDTDGKPAKQPDCNICGLPVFPGDAWDISHMPVPAALGGEKAGVAHRDCNQLHNNQVVTPMVAKTKRQRRKHVGAERPGMGPHALPCGKGSKLKKTIRGEVVPRTTQSEEHMRFMAQRFGGRSDG